MSAAAGRPGSPMPGGEPLLAPNPALVCAVVTRPQPQADEWVARLHALGQPAVALPLLQIAEAPDPAAVAEAWARLPAQQLVMFVSPSAVERFFAQAPAGMSWPAGQAGEGAPWAGSTGPGTERALQAAGVPASAIVTPPAAGGRFDSEALWQQLAPRRDWAGTSVLVVRGEGGREWLADTLRQHGARVHFVEAYRRTAPVPDAAGQAALARALAEPAKHVWLFSSSEAVRQLPALAPQADWSRGRALATHERIAEAAAALGFGRVDRVLPEPQAVRDALAPALAAPPMAHALAMPLAASPSIQSAPTVNDTAAPAVDSGADATSGAAMAAAVTPAAASGASAAAPPAAASSATVLSMRGAVIAGALVGALAVASLTLAWFTQQRVKSLEQELVRRQQDSQRQAIEARALATQSQEVARAVESKVALLEGRVAETALQRSQLEELIQQLSRSRDENVLADIDAAIRVAVQQTAITGSAEPLIGALRQAEERLARINQPRTERVRRALARDIDRVKAVALTDIASLTIRLDEAVRLADELPLLSQPDRRAAKAPAGEAAAPARKPAGRADAWFGWIADTWGSVTGRVWAEVRALVRVTRIDNPEAMLVAPEQAWFLRENLKLRLLNARLALMSRQFDTAQSDLRDAQSSLERYFDRSSRRVNTSIDLVRQVAGQARQLSVPRPDETLAAISAAQAGR